MKTLKQLISRYMYMITGVLVVIILSMILLIQINTEQKRAYSDGIRTIKQIESVLLENQQELDEILEDYKQTCVKNAEAAARIIEVAPEVLNNVEELQELAALLEVDEIHVFDKAGRIFTGTHPQYVGYTFDSGEQMMFFKPLLSDKTLKLVQPVTPNTADAKPMQYSALWAENEEYIVQVGMEPVRIMELTEKNELSHIFSLFRVNPDANYFAIDIESGEIVGSTDLKSVGLHASETGLNLEKIQSNGAGFYSMVNGKISFCVFEKIGENYIGRVILEDDLYQRVPATVIGMCISLTIVVFVLAKAVVRYMNKYVVEKIDDVNETLKSIADGNLNERLDIQSSVEFAELSKYINLMVKSLLANNKKMSYALKKTNLQIGTYEYGHHTKKVRYTEYIPKIFLMDNEKIEELAKNPKRFELFLKRVKDRPFADRYIRLEEVMNEDGVFGVAVDVTTEICKRIEIEKERDMDTLTGLYNRRGLDNRLEKLFAEPQKLGYSAIFMIDADGLKRINDTYGHEKGDLYLKKIGQVVAEAGTRNSIASRQGGDEYVLLLYGYDTIEELLAVIKELEGMQTDSYVALDGEINVPLRFSMGYCFINENADYQMLLKEADEKMYKNKLQRRKNR